MDARLSCEKCVLNTLVPPSITGKYYKFVSTEQTASLQVVLEPLK
jgi:hypothetical protein